MPTTIPTTTSTTRPGSPSTGDAYFETDTNNYIIYDGANWRGYASDGASGWSGSNTYSMNFDGTDDRLDASVVTSSATSGTISAWVKTNTSAFMPIFSVSNNSSGVANEWITFQVDNNGKFEIASNRLGTVEIYESSSTITDNAWHHVMVTSNGSSYKLFLDGSEQTSASGNNTGTWIGDVGTKDACTVGAMRRNTDISNTYFNGNIDEVAIWDSDQSSNISTIYSSGSPGNLLALNPKAWLRMGDGLEANSGTTVYDMSAFSNNMTMVSSPAYQSDTP
jgi:hypothetical protein